MSTLMSKALVARAVQAAALLAMAPFVHAATDPANDFLSTFAGSAASTDLDVISASVSYNAATDAFTLSSTLNGPVGLTPTGLYVWGVNRGAGTAGFAANGLPGVLFDRVILLKADGTGSIAGGGSLPSGAVTVSGNTITGVVSASALPSTGFNKQDYTWNLWPRDTAFSGFSAISDFAPNNSNLTTTAVPEPSSYALMLTGLLATAWVSRKSKRS